MNRLIILAIMLSGCSAPVLQKVPLNSNQKTSAAEQVEKKRYWIQEVEYYQKYKHMKKATDEREVRSFLASFLSCFQADVFDKELVPSQWIFETYFVNYIESSREYAFVDKWIFTENCRHPDPIEKCNKLWLSKYDRFELRRLKGESSCPFALNNARGKLDKQGGGYFDLKTLPSVYLKWLRSKIPLEAKTEVGAVLGLDGKNTGILVQIFFNQVETWAFIEHGGNGLHHQHEGLFLRFEQINGKVVDEMWEKAMDEMMSKFIKGKLWD